MLIFFSATTRTWFISPCFLFFYYGLGLFIFSSDGFPLFFRQNIVPALKGVEVFGIGYMHVVV